MKRLVLALVLAGCGTEPAGAAGSASAPASASASPVQAASAPLPGASAASSSSALVASATPSAEPAGPPAGMVEVAAGMFMMGSSFGNPEERPAHERVMAAYFMDETEVTTSAYAKCVAAGAGRHGTCKAAAKPDAFCNAHMPDHGEHPINCIDWSDAAAYCAFVGKRLPNEAEWEYAAAGGAENRRFSWGNHDPTTKISCFSHPGGTCPVKTFAPGAFGLHDMSGNVWEWTDSWASSFPDEPTTGTRRIFKGGSWSRRWPKWLRVKNRSHWEPENRNSWLGFRCVQTKLPLSCPADAAPAAKSPSASATEQGRCERVRGEPTCETGHGWNGSACTTLGGDGKPVAKEEPRPIDKSQVTDPNEPISVSRHASADPDCVKNYPGKPVAYRWDGNTWEARIKLVAAKGCTRRDNGTRWVGACCPN